MSSDEMTEYVSKIAEGIANFLEPRGFVRQNLGFNRWTRDGLCQVFDLQMGIKSLEGEFTANLGIFIPEVYQSTGREPPDFIKIGDCALTARFCDFLDADDDWWEITPYTKALVQELIDLLQTYGLSLFIKFPDRLSLINNLLEFNEKMLVCINPELDIALILEYLGRHDEAQALFRSHYRKSKGYNKHIEHLEKLAEIHNWETG